ncbi:carnitine O-palmitoyltransferase 2, mitochondrial isoform X2 [Daktulosphaira vitifoliae]|uniref:carnitine O-palmitoyltransferase 2, mitochondrial isoform X2 n=1 Tax=Daktulosphaira vitifoliae TaxID=58002 RepID=UPI0021AA10F9|nr:carnitine O-palmitoyltransferase 2, mitochondrial isoform X2 [Daktulosphaira vitifoliae]
MLSINKRSSIKSKIFTNTVLRKKNFSKILTGFAQRYYSDDYQFIQQSVIPTMHFQRSLPRLPIPELNLTCQRYLRAQKPLLSVNDYSKTKAIVDDFEKNEGQKLQSMLKEKNNLNKNTSYITADWSNMYLSDRTPLPINYNPILVFKHVHQSYNSQLLRSTNLLISSLRFFKSLQSNLLEPEIFHLNPKKSDTSRFKTLMKYIPETVSWYGAYLFNAYPLDMSQYSSLFRSTRIPMVNKDILHKNDSSKHIVIMRRGHFYKIDVLDEKGNILSPGLLLSRLQYILNQNVSPSNHPVGILTTSERNNWAHLRNHLINLGNKEILDTIDDSLMMIALDDEKLNSEPNLMTKQYLHSNGTNRWFDKSFTLIVCGDGTAGLNFEHSWGDGVAVLRYFQDISQDSVNSPKCHPDNVSIEINSDNLQVVKLEFTLDDKIKRNIEKTMNEFKNMYESLDTNYFEFFDVGRNTCKKFGISADSLMQLCFQLGNFKLHKKHVGSYESCSTAAFKHGRTETIRPCTIETANFCEAISNKNKPSNDELVNMIKKCSIVHSQLVKEGAMGQGFDRHLFALRLLAEKNNLNIPKLFTDPAHKLINYNIISTSSLTSNYIWLGGFGPVVKNGYGIGYKILEEYTGAIITNYNQHTDGDKFRDVLTKSLNQILDVLKTN